MSFQRTFAAGEISPTYYGGADQNRYQAALATCRNFIIMRNGGTTLRGGTRFIAEVKDSTTKTYLLKFIFNDTDTYVIEAGANYFRFYRQGGQVVGSSFTAWSSLTAYNVGDMVSHSGTNYYCILGNTNQSPPNATYWYPLTGDIIEIPTPYAAADIPLLKSVQSGDVVTLTHPSYPIHQLNRLAGTWTLTSFSTAPWASAPTGVSATPGAAGTLNPKYVVTAVKATTYEETDGSTAATCTSSATPTQAAPNVISWSAVTGAVEYNVYCDGGDGNGIYGFIGFTPNTTFNDIGFVPDASVTPPSSRTLFNATGDYPKTSTYYQQRQLFAGSANNPQQVDASRTGAFPNFGISSPIQDDDAIEFGVAGRRVNEVRHMIDTGKLVLLTSTGEFLVEGDSDGVLRPTAINLKQQTYYGAADIIPVLIGATIVYVQARGSMLRDLALDPQSITGQYDGQDLTRFATHLFEGHTITRLDYAQIPHSILWALRDDGTLLGCTYIKEDGIFGWHRHDTLNGVFEDVVTVPEVATPPTPWALGIEEDAVYVIANRTINGSTKRYVERLASNFFNDYRLDAYFLDASLTYDGINLTATTMTLTTAGGWTPSDLLTITASASFFTAGMVGDGITIWIPNVVTIRVSIDNYVSGTVVTGHVIAVDVPAGLQATATTAWSLATATVTGLTHLASTAVSYLANGVPGTGTVDGSGNLTLSGLADVVTVGLPITNELETLDIDSAQQPIRDQQKLIHSASVLVELSRGFKAGPDLNHLRTFQPAAGAVLGMDVFSTTGGVLVTALQEINLNATWAKPGRIVIQQPDPLPLSVLGIVLNGPVGK